MTAPLPDEVPETVRYYLDRIRRLLDRIGAEPDTARLLSIRLAPDMFDTGFHLAVAIRFAARALCPPAGLDVPEIPEEIDRGTLAEFGTAVAHLTAPIRATDLVQPVNHRAGEARLVQDPADYVLRFALPNMLFHLSLAHAGLRHGGMAIGKADFDGLHRYP
ncbi:MAG: DUF1993 family protein [Jannaschia sp.]